MVSTPTIICLGFSIINSCLSMAIPSPMTTTYDIVSNNTATFPTIIVNATKNNTTSAPTRILRVRIRVHNSLIEALVNKKQLDLIEMQLRQRFIPYHQVQDNKDGITIIVGPFHKSENLTVIMMMFNQSRFHANFTKMMLVKSDYKNQTIHSDNPKLPTEHFPMSVEAHEYDLAHDQESYEFRNCLESCEVSEDNELKPDHNCIREKCLKEITGI